jgi:hypothetical protein
MGFAAVNAFVCSAEWAQITLYLADKPECGSLLLFAGILADRTIHTDFRHETIAACNIPFPIHNSSS